MRASLIWEKLLVEDRRIVTSDEVGELSKKLGKEPKQAIDYLQRNGFIVRILRGIFYVKDYEERGQRILGPSLYDMIAMALERKGVDNWYFGLETALKLNNMTHEYFTVDRVITDSFRTTKAIKITGSDFHFMRWRGHHFDQGIVKNGRIRYSDKEKTVLDLAYRDYLAGKKRFMSAFSEYEDQMVRERILNYLSDYPPRFREVMVGKL